MKHVRQPTGSRLCGQACLAMILGFDLVEGIKRMGHERATRTRELVAALNGRAFGTRLQRYRGELLPECAVLRVRQRSVSASHFVVKNGTLVFDPELPVPFEFDQWALLIGKQGLRVTSYLRVRGES